jgi:N-acetylmuramoyl-L-alanine amidase
MTMARGSGEIVIGGKRFNIGWPVVNFMDDRNFNAHTEACVNPSQVCPGGIFPFAQYRSPKQRAAGQSATMRKMRYRWRRISEHTYSAAQAVIKQFVVHLDGCADAEMCFNVLHNERGLSCHFLIDNDGTIYQTLDLIACAFHAAGLNESSIGVELANRGDAKKFPGFYDKPRYKKWPRDVVTCSIHNDRYLAYSFTDEQYGAMSALGLALSKLLPNIKLEFPMKDGKPHWTLVPDFKRYQGYMGHYHIEVQKWDPGPWDWQRFMRTIRGRRSFPLGITARGDKAEMPSDPAELEAAAVAYYANNEQEGEGGGFFPVGPLEHYRLWHGGVHMHAAEGSPVVAPLQGYVVAARMGDYLDTIGSTNFVLIRHDIKVAGSALEFYSLYYHLFHETDDKQKAPKWMSSEGYGDPQPGTVVIFETPEPVQAGDIIGHVGLAGPDAMREPQLHFEIFAAEHGPVAKLNDEKFTWTVIDGSASRRLCTHKDIVPAIDTKKKDGEIQHDELFSYFRENPDAERMRKVVTYHMSEWTEGQWEQELANLKDLKLKPKQLEALVAEQITPALWWSAPLAEKLKLPSDGMIYTYHPLTFLTWLHEKLEHESKAEASDVKIASADDIRNAKEGKGMIDLDDVNGDSMIEESEVAELENIKPLELEDLIDGYGDDEDKK